MEMYSTILLTNTPAKNAIEISKGCDIHITTWAHSRGEYFTEVTFDGEASGRLTFENDTTKKLFKGYSIVDMDNNGDIYKTLP